ncbi:hypothetical protein [Marinobacter sp. C2H3]|uniref:hypothetical protein n=1 Tax=Marinobacter sp. C2H3 TaxID=3119003 RepID=UPI00300F26B5
MHSQSHTAYVKNPPAMPRKAEAGPPLSWIVQSMRLFRAHWGLVLSAYLLILLVTVLIQLGVVALMASAGMAAAVVASVIGVVVSCAINAGLLAVFHGLAEGRPAFSDVLAGFTRHALLRVLLMLVMLLLMGVALAAVGYLAVSFSAPSGAGFDSQDLNQLMMAGPFARQGGAAVAVAVVVGVVLVAVFATLFAFVLPLVVISRQGLFRAMANSFRASMQNILVLLFFGINSVVFAQLLMLPVFAIGVATASEVVLGGLVLIASLFWGAILGGAYYLSFRAIFLDEPGQASPSEDSAAAAV